MRSIILPLTVAAVAVIGSATAQTIPAESLDSMLEQAKTCYRNAEYENAISQLEKTLQFLELLKVSDRMEAYEYLAFSYVAFGDTDKAKEQFKKLLALNPRLELDPVTVSPKIIRVFEETKSEMQVSSAAVPTAVGTTPTAQTEVLFPPPLSSRSRLGAAWRSCMMPGWGQRYLGETGKGNKMTAAACISLGAALVTAIITHYAHASYINADPSSGNAIDNTYRSYKILYNVSALCIVSFIGIDIYSVGDAIFAGGNRSTSMVNPGRDYRQESGRNGISLCYAIVF
ncbi:MAG: hypothetical protein JXA71_05310 [Chitinispirillaceae bacterium]|nr:hypothetical protein [Chitinispirillaceae bacterium]